jgi:hypothetical protein
LKPDGFAYLSEFGGITAYPRPTVHLNHDEYSIHWGQMAFLAKRLGFQFSDVFDMASFLRFCPDVSMFTGDVHEIRHIFSKFGVRPPDCAAYSEAETRELCDRIPQAKIEGLEFAPLFRGMHWGPSPWEFKVLLLQR